MTLVRADPPNMVNAFQLQWPVTFVYDLVLLSGLANTRITVDAPILYGQPKATYALGKMFLMALIAPAMSATASCRLISCCIHQLGPSYEPVEDPNVQGTRFALPTSREDTPVAVLQTGHNDRWSRRRMFFPGAPRGWVTDHQINPEGAGELRTLINGALLGFGGTPTWKPLEWLNLYPDALAGPIVGYRLPGFRPITNVRLCSYPVPYPDFSFAS